MTTSSPELTFIDGQCSSLHVDTSHEINLQSPMRTGSVFSNLKKKVVFHMGWGSGDENAFCRTLRLLIQVLSFVIMDEVM